MNQFNTDYMESLFDIFLNPKGKTKRNHQGENAVESLMKILNSKENHLNSQEKQTQDTQQGQENSNSDPTPSNSLKGAIAVPEYVTKEDIKVEVFNKDFSLSIFVDFYDPDTHTIQEIKHTYHASTAIDFENISISLENGFIHLDAPYVLEEEKNKDSGITIKRSE